MDARLECEGYHHQHIPAQDGLQQSDGGGSGGRAYDPGGGLDPASSGGSLEDTVIQSVKYGGRGRSSGR